MLITNHNWQGVGEFTSAVSTVFYLKKKAWLDSSHTGFKFIVTAQM